MAYLQLPQEDKRRPKTPVPKSYLEAIKSKRAAAHAKSGLEQIGLASSQAGGRAASRLAAFDHWA